MGTSSFWNPQGLSRPVMGLFYLYFRVSMLFYVFVLCETSVTVYKPRWRNISVKFSGVLLSSRCILLQHTRVGTLIVATIYLQLIQNTYMFRSFTFLQCSHQHCVQPVASDVEVVGYL